VADRAALLLAFAEDAGRTIGARLLFLMVESWLVYSSRYVGWLRWFGDLHVPLLDALTRVESWLSLDAESKL
jgi:hypothetical protein